MAGLAGRGSPHRVRYALLAGALAVLPLALYPGSYVAWKTFAKLHQLLSGATWFGVRAWDPTRTGENYSWFGPLGLFLAIGVGMAAVVLVYRRKLPARAVLYAAAPFVWLVLLAATIVYEPWHGRFFIFPVALSAALWGMCMRVRPVVWAVVTVALATTVLSLVNNASKPSGLRLIEPNPPASVWTMDRWEVQSIQRPGVRRMLRFVEQRIPASSTVALALSQYGLRLSAVRSDAFQKSRAGSAGLRRAGRARRRLDRGHLRRTGSDRSSVLACGVRRRRAGSLPSSAGHVHELRGSDRQRAQRGPSLDSSARRDEPERLCRDSRTRSRPGGAHGGIRARPTRCPRNGLRGGWGRRRHRQDGRVRRIPLRPRRSSVLHEAPRDRPPVAVDARRGLPRQASPVPHLLPG